MRVRVRGAVNCVSRVRVRVRQFFNTNYDAVISCACVCEFQILLSNESSVVNRYFTIL